MKKKRAFGLLVLGMMFFVCGAIGARVFYEFPMAFFQVTIWEDVLVFSALGAVGLAIAVFATVALRRPR